MLLLSRSLPTRRRRATASLCLAVTLAGLVSACGQPDSAQGTVDQQPDVATASLLPHRPRPTVPPLQVPTTTTPPPTRVTPKAPDESDPSTAHYAVGLTNLQYTDTTRSSAARGTSPAKSARSFVVTVRYPAGGPVDVPEGQLDPARTSGPFPLVVFVHDIDSSAARYDQLLHSLSAAGYVVVAPDFPLTSSALDGATVPADVANQPGDIKFLVSKLLTANDRPGVLQNLIATDKIAVAGHAFGGVTAAATGYNPCCTDTRVKAVVAMSTAEGVFPEGWFTPPSKLPFLDVHGDKDGVVPIEKGRSLYDAAPSPKWFVTIAGGDHAAPFTDGPEAPSIARLIAEFLDGVLKQDAGALPSLADDANLTPFSLQSEGA